MLAFADHGEVDGDQVTTQVRRGAAGHGRPGQGRHRLRRRDRDPRDARASTSSSTSWDELVETVKRPARPGRGTRAVSETLEVVATGAAADAIRAHVPALVADGFAGRLFAQDATLWGPEAEEESAKRLSWVGLPRTSRPLVGEVSALRSELAEAGVDHVVLCGMGGSSLAPEVICATYGVELTVLDSSNPDQVRDGARRPARPHRRRGLQQVRLDRRDRLAAARLRAGVHRRRHRPRRADRDRHRPGQPARQAVRAGTGYRVVNADPDVGGRYSALTAFGLVPSGLAGADIGAAARRGRGGLRPARRRRRGQPRPAARRRDGRHQPAAQQAGARRPGLRARRVRRLGRAADRREHRQAGHRRAARRRRRRLRARGGAAAARRHRRPARATTPRPTTQRRPRRRTDAGSAGSDVVRHRTARRADAALGGRDRHRRPAARHQPVRPARRGERQDRGPLDARGQPGQHAAELHRRTRRGPRARRRLARRRRHAARARSPRCSARSTASRGTSR